MLEFTVDDNVFLHISPIQEVKRFHLKGKLVSRFVVPFQIVEQIGAIANQLALSPALTRVHNVFYVSVLQKYVLDLMHVLENLTYHSPFHLDVTYEEFPVRILDHKEY